MNSMEKTISELHGMLKTAEKNIKNSTKDVLMVNKGKGMKKVGKGKGKNYKGFQKPKPKTKLKPKSKAESQEKPPKEGICFFLQWTRSLEKKLQTISGWSEEE